MTSAMDKYYKPIEKLLQVNGAMGVNAIARELDVPVSSVQKWLERQRYFVKNDRRWWELPSEENTTQPQRGNSSPVSYNHGLTGELKPVIDGQLASIQRLQEMLASQLRNTVEFILEYEIKGPPPHIIEKEIAPPVADLDPRLIQLEEEAKKLYGIFHKKDIKSNIPDEYKDLLHNYDHIGLVIKEGKDYTTKFLEDEIFLLLSGQINTLSEETVGILRENQK